MLKTSTGSLGRDFFISFKTSSPPLPGMVISSTTTSHFSFQTLVRASWPVLASPKWTRLNSSGRICFKPWRTTAWSSAISILMELCFIRPRGSGERDFDRDDGACARVAGNGEFAAEQRGALAHAEESDRFRVGDLIS